ncbi:MAG: hypothetical protein WKF34_14540 [Pyrinomonadaceae bacterium]
MSIITFIFNFSLLWQATRRTGIDTLAAVVIVIVLVVIFTIFSIALVFAFFSYKRRQKRIAALKQFAAENGWKIVPEPTLNSFQHLDRYSLFRGGHWKSIAVLLQKRTDDGQISVFDCIFSIGASRSARNHTTTVIAFHSPRLQLPYFRLYPESLLSSLGELLGWNYIDFASHPEFSSRYKLSGEDEMHVRQMFHPQVLTSFESMPDLSVDGGGNYIFAYTLRKVTEVESLNTYIKHARIIFGLFHQ